MDTAQLGELLLPDPAGVAHRVGGYWQEQRLLLVFLRHFG